MTAPDVFAEAATWRLRAMSGEQFSASELDAWDAVLTRAGAAIDGAVRVLDACGLAAGSSAAHRATGWIEEAQENLVADLQALMARSRRYREQLTAVCGRVEPEIRDLRSRWPKLTDDECERLNALQQEVRDARKVCV